MGSLVIHAEQKNLRPSYIRCPVQSRQPRNKILQINYLNCHVSDCSFFKSYRFEGTFFFFF